MKFLTSTKVTVRWTTDMKTPIESLYEGKGLVMGIKRAACFEDELSKKIGYVDRIVTYTVKGKPVDSEELMFQVEQLDHIAWNKKDQRKLMALSGVAL